MEKDSFYEVLHRLTNIPLFVIDQHNQTSAYNSLNIPDKINAIIKSNHIQVAKSIDKRTVSRLTDLSNMSYIGFTVEEDKVIIGPFLEQEADLNNLTALKKRLRLIGEEAILLDNMFHQLRVLNTVELLFLYYVIETVIGIDTKQLDIKRLTPQKVQSAKTVDVDSLFKEFEFVKRNYEVEDAFLQIIESGDVATASSFRTHDIMSNLPDRALNDTLRNTKTRLTILNTLCNRAAIRGGIDVQLGHQISTNFGIQIEAMKSNFDSNTFMKEIIVAYAEAVKNYAIKDYSTLIRHAIFYIRRHITTNLSLHDIAEYLFVSKEHLSRQFKQETGTTVTKYINKAKVIEAKKLLKQRTHTILDIATILGFANSSHFSKVFKEYEGMTPKQYQTRHQKEH